MNIHKGCPHSPIPVQSNVAWSWLAQLKVAVKEEHLPVSQEGWDRNPRKKNWCDKEKEAEVHALNLLSGMLSQPFDAVMSKSPAHPALRTHCSELLSNLGNKQP